MFVVPFNRARTALLEYLLDCALLGEFRQRLLDSSKALIQELLLDFKHRDIEPGHRGHLRDARSHQPTTEYTDFLDIHISSYVIADFRIVDF